MRNEMLDKLSVEFLIRLSIYLRLQTTCMHTIQLI